MYGAVLDSEASKAEVGECAIVCEDAVLRATSAGGTDLPVVVGDNAVVGPRATLLGGVVEPACYVATGATVLPQKTCYALFTFSDYLTKHPLILSAATPSLIAAERI